MQSTTVEIENDLLKRARELTGIAENNVVVTMAIEALIAWESARQLAKLGAINPTLKDIRRR